MLLSPTWRRGLTTLLLPMLIPARRCRSLSSRSHRRLRRLSAMSTNVTGCAGNNGSITITAFGGTGTKQYSKDGGATWQTSALFGSLAAGTYTLQVKDAYNCYSNMQTATITASTAIFNVTTAVTN